MYSAKVLLDEVLNVLIHFLSLILQTSAFSPTIDEQYRQLYHPTEDYRGYGSDSSPGSPYNYEGIANGFKRGNSQTNLDPIKEESTSKAAKQNASVGARENNNTDQYMEQTLVSSRTSNLPSNSVLAPLQGQGQQGSTLDQRSSQVQSKQQQKSTADQHLPISQSEGQQDSNIDQRLPVPKSETQKTHLGQRSFSNSSCPDNLQEVSPVSVQQRSDKGHLSHSNQGQQSTLPQVQIQPGANIPEPSPPREGGHVRTNVQVAPKFSIQSSEEGDDSPPTPKGKFYI